MTARSLKMLQIAIPNKGALSDGSVELLKEAGYKCVRYGRELVVADLSYIVIYAVQREELVILRVLHTSMKYP